MSAPEGYRASSFATPCAESAESAESVGDGGFPRIPRLPRRGTWETPDLEPAALYGLAGQWAEAMQPFTEASVVGSIISTLLAFGNAAGGSPYVQVGAIRHRCNENAVLVGPTSTSRKGETMTIGLRPIELADPAWTDRIQRGFGSGEAVVMEVRDRVVELDDEGDETVVDTGASDKRLLIHEDELAHVLAVAGRDGSTLSPLMRNAWDGRRLENRVKRSKAVATDAHVSVVSGITRDELLRRVPEVEIANGFLNRFLIVAVTRSKLLADPPPIRGDLEAEYVEAFADRLRFARREGSGAIRRDSEASAIWTHAYEDELAVERYGLAGAACSRAEAHTLRLSMLYALLDRSTAIRREHVEAALALWRYCEQSALLIFGDRLGDPTADTILDALDQAGETGLTRDELRDVFSRHRTRGELDSALRLLLDAGWITEAIEETGGRPATRYRLAARRNGR
jgi:hypothetical protein